MGWPIFVQKDNPAYHSPQEAENKHNMDVLQALYHPLGLATMKYSASPQH